ncbi:glycine cleavage system H protein [Kitasatospora sp. MAA19]|uniref:glycine cleavage system protein GcvH n=1 Tax=unclassified Kitasatospora TaxID=2633591 RepID=UPI002476903A|nr:glycine cleavage system protein GcvH [Kitasatospora sp. MAA19]MDH6704705.1 glycine cleavage system H protein [Kitasatospora sp. MAA19]
MANVPADLKYTKDHEWVRTTGKNKAQVGITDFAQKQLGDIVFVDIPTVGKELDSDEAFGTVESVKAVSELFMPLTGTITAVNEELDGEPELINTDPYGDGWMVELTLTKPDELKQLLTAAQYEAFIAEGAE